MPSLRGFLQGRRGGGKERDLNVAFLQELLSSVAEQGRALLPRALFGAGAEEDIEALARALISGRGEASGVAIARELLDRYAQLEADDRAKFFRFLATELRADGDQVAQAAQRFLDDRSDVALAQLQKALDSPRLEFFRRLNLAPGATAEIVAMRRDLLGLPLDDPALAAVDADLRQLLYSWFNRGFLVLRRIDWHTPAAILEKIIRYEAVHEIQGWDDLRRRLDPADRRCFAFFHPSLIDEPLVFVEVALMREVPAAIGEVLEEPLSELPAKPATTAVFYSISNCQDGLRGISFGNFLLKQVVEELAREQPALKTFVTLSPVPRFAAWLAREAAEGEGEAASAARGALHALRRAGWPKRAEEAGENGELAASLPALAAHYFLVAKGDDGKPLDPVARFHLGNGARLDRINLMADPSPRGLRDACGLMVNYRYDLKEIERNHEAFANEGVVAASRAVRALLKVRPKGKPAVASSPESPALPPPAPVGNES
jgi:malonyl-CoA decarboxylase